MVIKFCLSIVVVSVWLLLAADTVLAQAQSVTYYRAVAPILQRSCQSCHRPGEVGPMPLGSFEQVRPYARAIKQAVLARKMPPWNIAAPPGRFHNDPSLSQQEIDTLVTWADNGAPAGNPNDAPPPRAFAEGWFVGTPDLVFEMPQPYDVPSAGTIECRRRFREDEADLRLIAQPLRSRLSHVQDPG